MQVAEHELSYYAAHSIYSSPGRQENALNRLPDEIPALCEAIHGFLIHVFHTRKYGVTLDPARIDEMKLYTLEEMLDRLAELAEGPPLRPRPPGQRLLANCRDFALFLCAMLRTQGIPARLRIGFEAYFHRKHGRFGDHTVCEYWRAPEERWVLVDPQLDDVQRTAFKIDFDPCDLPEAEYLTAGRAWQACRAGRLNPDKCGILDRWGIDYVRGNVLRDVMALNREELFPWDGSILGNKGRAEVTEDDLALLDELAEATWPHVDAPRVRTLYETHPEVHGIRMRLETDGMDPAM